MSDPQPNASAPTQTPPAAPAGQPPAPQAPAPTTPAQPSPGQPPAQEPPAPAGQPAPTQSPPVAPGTPGPHEGQGGKAPGPNQEPAKPPEPPKSAAPEKYDLKIPKNSNLTPTRLDKIAASAKERGLSNEDAQRLVEQESEAVGDYVQSLHSEFSKRQDSWIQSLKSDQEVGGENFKQNAELAHRVINRFGTESLQKELTTSGLGNHPELVRMCVRIGKMMSDDQLVLPMTQTAMSKRAEDVLYDHPTSKKEA